MNSNVRLFFILSYAALFVTGCASSSQVYEISPGLYTVTSTGDGFTTSDRVVDLAMGKAQDTCKQKGLRLNVVNQEQSKTRMDIDTTIKISFRCV